MSAPLWQPSPERIRRVQVDVIHGRPVRNREALANLEALELSRELPELRR